jgi:DNA-binding MarR family transcriptional regulator
MSKAEQAKPSAVAHAGAPLRVRTAHLLSRAGRAQSARLAAQLAGLDLRPKHFALLNLVELSEGSSQQQLGRSLQMDPSALVETIDDLERKGLAERRRDPADRRRRPVYLTRAGRITLGRARAAARQAAEDLLGSLDDEQVASLSELLETVVVDLDRGVADASPSKPRQ